MSSPSYPSPMSCRLPSSSSCFLPLPIVVLCPPLPAVEVVLPPAIHPTSSCLWGWGQVVCRPSLWVIVMGPWRSSSASSSLLGGILACFRGVSGDVAGYGVPRARTWQASSSRGLPVSLCALLVRIDNLTSRLNGEEGFALSLSGGGCTAVVPFVSCSLVPRNK